MISAGYKSAYQQGYSDAMRDFRKESKAGYWIEHHKSNEFGSIYKCSLCGSLIGNKMFNYCPNCGARMAESEEGL